MAGIMSGFRAIGIIIDGSMAITCAGEIGIVAMLASVTTGDIIAITTVTESSGHSVKRLAGDFRAGNPLAS
jgi:hypothetical protein